MIEAIILENIDTGLLDEQRLALSRAVIHLAGPSGWQEGKDDLLLLDGLLNMLDAWSDERLAASEGTEP